MSSPADGIRDRGSWQNPGWVGAIDQGTTSTRFFLYDHELNVVGSHQMEFTQIHPQAGWVEHDPKEILMTVRECMTRAIQNAASTLTGETGEGEREGEEGVRRRVKAVGLTNQRETTVVWRKSTGEPLYNAIVWMDSRTSPICTKMEKEMSGGREHFRGVTGLPISSYFSAVKLMWLLEHVPEFKAAVEQGDALFGTVDTWIIWNMTGGAGSPEEAVHATDCTNASRTMLMDVATCQWHKETIEALGIPESILPRITSNAEKMGDIAQGWPLHGAPLAGCLGDQHAAMLGQRCRPKEAKATYGTGCFILLNTGQSICPSSHGLLSTLAYKLGPNAPVNYALEGSIGIAGAAVQWLRDSLGVISKAQEVETLAKQVDSTGGVYFVPAFSGLLAPRWREDARGVLVGISRYSTKCHVARAVLESICFQVKEVLDAMHVDAGVEGMASEQDFTLRVDGGAAVNNTLLQLQADILGCTVIRPASIETTALGAAFAAGIAVGLWDESMIFQGHGGESSGISPLGLKRAFLPELSADTRAEKFKSWCTAVERSLNLADLV